MKLGSHSHKHDILKTVPLFSNLSKKSLDEISKIADEVEKKNGSVLAQEGEVGVEFVLILEGAARVEKGGKVINSLAPNSFFGEISIIDKNVRTASVIADSDVKLLVIHSRHFNELLDTVPDLSKEIITALCKYLRDAQKKTEGLS